MEIKIAFTNALRFIADFIIVASEICAWTTFLILLILGCMLLFL